MTGEHTQTFETAAPGDIPALAESLKAEGYRMAQICGVTKQGCTEVIYTFDKDFDVRNFKVDIPFGTQVKSITPWYWAAFVYENEIHDLFDVEFTDSKLDYKGNFFRMSQKTPWKGKEAEETKEGA